MIIGTYSGGSASAYEYSTFPELLSQLPDNTGNLIDAINVRNSVYTLWQRVSQVQNVASQSASASTTYTNSNPTPLPIFGIPPGSTFNNKTMTEMWNDLLYPYVPPTLSLSVSSISGLNYFTTGLTNSALFIYSIIRYTNDIYSYNITGTTYSSGLSFTGVDVGSQLNATFSSNVYSNNSGANSNLNTIGYLSGLTQSYVFNAKDVPSIPDPNGFSHSYTAYVKFVHPSFYGFNQNKITNNALLGSFMNSSTRVAIPYLGSQSFSFNYNGSGYLYFVVPNIYPLLSKIKDPNGFIIHDSTLPTISTFTYSTYSPTGGNNLPTVPPSYRVYRTIGTCSYIGSGNFEFIF